MRKLWHQFDLWLCKDIVQDELTNAIHPDFGWIWQEGENGYKYIEQSRREGYQVGFKDGYKLAHDPVGYKLEHNPLF